VAGDERVSWEQEGNYFSLCPERRGMPKRKKEGEEKKKEEKSSKQLPKQLSWGYF